MIDTTSLVQIYEIDGKEVPVGGPKLEVRSEGGSDSLVQLRFKDLTLVVSRRDLEAAMTNATNRGVL